MWPQLEVSVSSWAARAGRMRAWYSAWATASAGCAPAGGRGRTTGRTGCPGRTGTGRASSSRGRGRRPGGRSRGGRPARPRPSRAMGSWRSAAASFHHAGGGLRTVAVGVGVGGGVRRAVARACRVLAQRVADAGDQRGELVSCSWWSASCCSAAVIGSVVMVSSRGRRCRCRGAIRRARGRGCRVRLGAGYAAVSAGSAGSWPRRRARR